VLALMRGKMDVAFLRRETQTVGLSFRFLTREPLIAVLPADHRLASRKKIRPHDLARESYISPARLAPAPMVAFGSIGDIAGLLGAGRKRKRCGLSRR
jgi:DNA-binding transcriptional LysR family regulator